MYDLLISGGTVVDPATGLHERRDVAVRDGLIAAVAPAIQRDEAREVFRNGTYFEAMIGSVGNAARFDHLCQVLIGPFFVRWRFSALLGSGVGFREILFHAADKMFDAHQISIAVTNALQKLGCEPRKLDGSDYGSGRGGAGSSLNLRRRGVS